MKSTSTHTVLCIAAALSLAFPNSDLPAQLPGPPPSGIHGCLRPDVEKTKELIRQAMARGSAAGEVVEVMKEVQGCTSYTVTFQSSVNIISNTPPGGTRRIKGRGFITFGLAPDRSEEQLDMTSGPSELTAPIFWSEADITLGNGCLVTTIALPYTAFGFWLGVKTGAQPVVNVQISPAGDEQHFTKTKCPNPMGGWSAETPGREQIFTPGWIALHSNVTTLATGVTPAQMTDPAKMKELAKKSPAGGLDMAKLQAMAGTFGDKPPTADNMGEVAKLMREVVPNADQQIVAARDNFMFKMPGDCVGVSATMVRCTVNRTSVGLPDNKGGTQTITESTVITIIRGATSGTRS